MDIKYTLLPNNTVKKEINGETWHIPPDLTNSDYQQYIAWVEAGNKPLSEILG